jgi:hypothetical protein
MLTGAEILLIIGTFGIMLGVWVTLAVIIGVSRETFKRMEAAAATGCGCGGNCQCKKKG